MPGINKITGTLWTVTNKIVHFQFLGLDPSGPYFEGMPNEVKLDSADANFVEVIHTDAFYRNHYQKNN